MPICVSWGTSISFGAVRAAYDLVIACDAVRSDLAYWKPQLAIEHPHAGESDSAGWPGTSHEPEAS